MEYRGYEVIRSDDERLAEFYEAKANIFNLLENQYLIIKNEDGQDIDYYKKKNDQIEKVKYNIIDSHMMGMIKPKNFAQYCAIDLLSDDRIPVKLIRGVYGSGKDFLMSAKAFDLINKGKYEKIIYIRPNVTVKNVPDIGYLPAGVFDKLSWTLGPLYDKVGGEEGVNYLIEGGKLELMPLLFVRGRSFENSIIYVSEGQNFTTEIAKLLLGRIGKNSIMMINADTHQTDNKVFDQDNGITTMIEKLSGNPLFGYVYLDETLRSETANLANLLD